MEIAGGCVVVCVRAYLPRAVFCVWVCGVVWCGVVWVIGCTNNNYASREKCKKCGQPKEVAALSALAIPGASHQTHLHYFTSGPEPIDQPGSLLAFSNAANQASVLKEWRSGDWICRCGFHNYSSRIQVWKWVHNAKPTCNFRLVVYSFLFCNVSAVQKVQ